MAPRKKPSSSSTRKSNLSRQQPPSSKYGIQHFFERHSQTQAVSASPCPPELPKPDLNSNPKTSPKPSPNADLCPNGSETLPAALPQQDAEANSEKKSSPISPEFIKNAPFKRFKFSPLIKQSQDDGGDEISWKISPLNQRFRPFNANKLPRTMSILADQPRPIGSFIHPCLQQQNYSCTSAASFQKWLSSPSSKDTGESFSSSRLLSAEQDTEPCIGNESACMESSSKVFQTPPSSSCDVSKGTVGVVSKDDSHELGFGLHHKTFLELLDQVGDVVIDKAVPTNITQNHNFGNPSCRNQKNCNLEGKKAAVTASQKINGSINDDVFLVLEVSEKCRTADSSRVLNPYKVLRLLHELTGEERALYLCDEWFYSIIGPGDTVSVVGKFDEEGKCIVNHSNNLAIVFPDILMSGTRVASSFSCPRRAVLDERLRASEYSSPALVGTMLHQIFQAGLLKDSPTRNFLEECAIITLQKNIENLYACGADQNATLVELVDAIPRIIKWIKCFRNSEEGDKAVVDFGQNEGRKEISIIEVMDIEEMAWAPKYGLKGIIDASLRVKKGASIGDSTETIIPLEFKTGKGTTGQTALEHCAQVILYTLLMSERYLHKDVDSGLLYYLHTDETRGIKVQRSDLVGLIMRRNELASDILKASTTQVLPPMLKNPAVCKNCRHLNSCSIYHKAYVGSYEASGLGDLYDRKTGHLNVVHIEFLKHWDRLIDLEAKTCQVAGKEIFRAQHLRENSSSCLSSLVLDVTNGFSEDGSLHNGRFVYHFVHQRTSQHNHEIFNLDIKQASEPQVSLVCSLRCGDFVIISMVNGRPAVAQGIICGINEFHISISLSRRLRIPGNHHSSKADLMHAVWRIDKDEIATSYSMMRFNLLELFDSNLQISRLRKMVVDLEAPRFDSGGLHSQDPAVSYVHLENCINDDQRRAIKKILSAKDYTLILGMPGTGKTSTIVHAVKALLIRGASILLTSYTNSAIDNLLIKLKAQGIDFIRLGRQEAVHEDIRQYCFTDIHSVEDVKLRMDQIRVVGVTCLGIKHPLLVNKKFDVCIMDEAGQITLPVSLGPLMLASTFVLVGDHYQLPPLVQSTEARENGMAVSLFCRLSEAHPQAISALQSQYRMCAGIMELSNALIYGNRLSCGSLDVANAKMKLSLVEPIKWWLKEVLDPNKSVVFINTDMLPAPEVREKNNVHNPVETLIISEITLGLLEREISEDEIGIITPYNSQASHIQCATSACVEIHTIDKYQGRDKDCLIISFVRSVENSKSCSTSLLGDWRRINVALTRAKKKLIMVGSCGTLSNVPLLKLLIDKVNELGGTLNISNKDLCPA